ncbi:MAG TPA: glycosyltransferase family 2 protein [Candidatus Saccharimonadales bacterium]|nr:glycosyltransferase family 2 protein [Candidatus Saccharimonadales bacterium]
MTDIEIPLVKDRKGHYRFFEMLPALLTYFTLLLPLLLTLINVTIAAIFIILYLLIYITRAIASAIRVLEGYRELRKHQKLDWPQLVTELQAGEVIDASAKRPKWHYENLLRLTVQPKVVEPNDVMHAIFIAVYKESREVVEPTINSVINSHYDMKKVILYIAYEERGGEQTDKMVKQLIKEYGKHFYHAEAVKHPADIPNELIGKGGNVTFAGRRLQEYVAKQKIDPLKVIVTTLDADNRPDKNYLAALTYVYCSCHDPLRASFQPTAMYTNNIWDAPAPMRVLATGNSVFHIMNSLRFHALRNFSAHAQGLASLIETDFWSVRTIVEDGHQFWRCYFRFEGNYRVYPIFVPIYQDAVLNDSYVKTLKAQFVQLRRWTYGASDIAYVIDKGFFKKNKVPRMNLIAKTARLIEGHVSWAAAPLLGLTAGFIPGFIDPQSFAANELPLIASRVQTVALAGALTLVFICLKTLPPRPERYRRRRTFLMLMQWAYLPITTIVYNSFAALYSQTRLLFGRYLDKFDVTEKAVVSTTASGQKVVRK